MIKEKEQEASNKMRGKYVSLFTLLFKLHVYNIHLYV